MIIIYRIVASYIECASSVTVVLTTWITVSTSASNISDTFFGSQASTMVLNDNTYPIKNSTSCMIKVPNNSYVSIGAKQFSSGGALSIGDTNAYSYNQLTIRVV